jgi:V/A-type H+-transporting ATPase subunit I
MIIGDAGYGACFLTVAVLLHIKQKKVNNLVLLVYVVSIATIIWGALTGTWFGLEAAMEIPFLKKLVIPTFANYPEYFGYTSVQQQNVMMKFCFIIGTVQLSLACIMNIRRKIGNKDLSMVADIGWLMAINSLYYVVLLLVINEQSNLLTCAIVILAGFVLVCLFGGMAPGLSFSKGLKAGLADSFTNFLNTISAFGNIMSYIRLFAVGLASLAIAQSFNNMALGMTGVMRVFGILVFVLGHVLNLVMGLLSVIVHGVRLNLLEFSGQLGMEWSGTAYDPFRKS